jgi:hypothetical protein
MLLTDKIWWEGLESARIPTAIVAALVLGLGAYSVYRSSKNTPKRSPKVRGIERVVTIALWSFIAFAVILLLIFRS